MGKSISFWMRKQPNIFFIKGAREKVFGIFKWVASHQRHMNPGGYSCCKHLRYGSQNE